MAVFVWGQPCFFIFGKSLVWFVINVTGVGVYVPFRNASTVLPESCRPLSGILCKSLRVIMDRIKVKIINRSHHPLPDYATFEAAGMDVRAYLPDGPVVLKSLERALIHTGLYMQLPSGYECQIRPRSGLALKSGISIANSPGTVDADYRGEVGIILVNLGKEDFTVNDGDRICQMVIKQYSHVSWEEVGELDRTRREDGAFGHTGTK